jgi:hypothetical protein
MDSDKKLIERIIWDENDSNAKTTYREHCAAICESSKGFRFSVHKNRQPVHQGDAGTMRRAQIECETFIKQQYQRHHLFKTHNLAK